MYYIINEEILDWINTDKSPSNNPETENNFTYDHIGERDGENKLATSQVNRIMFKPDCQHSFFIC